MVPSTLQTRQSHVVITTESAEPGGDIEVFEFDADEIVVEQNRGEVFYDDPWALTPSIHSTAQSLEFRLRSYGYSQKTIPGAITKGALALFSDKYPDAELVPFLGEGATTEQAVKLRRKAKAVLQAAGAL